MYLQMKTALFSFVSLSVVTLCACISCSKHALPKLDSNDNSLDEFFSIPGTDMILRPTQETILTSKTKTGRETHYRVKFYPKNTSEQQFLEKLEDVSVSYVPFGYELVQNNNDVIASMCKPILETNPYTQLDFGPCYSNIGLLNQKKREEIHLPIIYAIWPIEKDLPTTIEYIIDSYLNLDGIQPPQDTRYPLRLQTYDSLLGTYVPLKDIKVCVSYMGYNAYQYTDNTGLVRIYTGLANITSSSQIPYISISVVTAGHYWSICPQANSTPYQIALGTIGSLWPTTASTVTLNLTSSTVQYEVFRAAEYYFSASNELYSSIHTLEYNPTFHLCNQDPNHPTLQGEAFPPTNSIFIYNVGLSQSEEIAVVLHELGHIRKWYHLGQTSYDDTDDWTHESYSCFLGAFLGEQYYLSNGFVMPYSPFFINTMGQQYSWTIGSTNVYSPFFIDLVDSYNQSTYSSTLPNDTIQDVPASLIDSLGIACTSKAQSLASLSNFTGVYYTLEQMNSFLSNY